MRNQEAAAVVLLDDELEEELDEDVFDEAVFDEPESEEPDDPDEPVVFDEDEEDRLSVR